MVNLLKNSTGIARFVVANDVVTQQDSRDGRRCCMDIISADGRWSPMVDWNPFYERAMM
jgi:hypothetical protein